MLDSIDAYLNNFQYSNKQLIENSDLPFFIDKIDVSLKGLKQVYSQ
jgi:hypothetical protein